MLHVLKKNRLKNQEMIKKCFSDGLQTVPYSIFSPINQEKWRQLAKEREMVSLIFNLKAAKKVKNNPKNLKSKNLVLNHQPFY